MDVFSSNICIQNQFVGLIRSNNAMTWKERKNVLYQECKSHFFFHHGATATFEYVLTLLGLLNLLKAKMDGDSLQVSKPEGNHLYRNSGGWCCFAIHCSAACTGLVTKGFVIAMPTFHAFFITHGRTATVIVYPIGWIARFLSVYVCVHTIIIQSVHTVLGLGSIEEKSG